MKEKKTYNMDCNNVVLAMARRCVGLVVAGFLLLASDPAEAQVVVSGSVYGGGALANVSGSTQVDILGGTINQNVFGGGLGKKISLGDDADVAAIVNGDATVNIGSASQTTPTTADGATYYNTVVIGDGLEGHGNVFGANDKNGTPRGEVKVNIYHTKHTAANMVGSYASVDALVADMDAKSHGSQYFALQGAYGGGNKANYEPTTSGKLQATVTIFGCENTVKMVYGGGRAADVGTTTTNANTIISVQGGRIDTLFAGGDGHTQDGGGDYIPANIYGDASAAIHGGYFSAAFAGSNTSGTISGTKSLTIDQTGPCASEQDEFIGALFGGGNLADLTGNVVLDVRCGTGDIKELYGGCNLANITGNVTLNMWGGTVENVFGGSKGRAASDPLGAKAANITGDVTLNLMGGDITNAFGGSNINGNITGQITVNVLDAENATCPLVVENVYGGGNLTAYSPTTTTLTSPKVNVVHVKQGSSVSGNVFGGGLGRTATVTAYPVVTIGAAAPSPLPTGYSAPGSNYPLATVGGNVYGGGSEAAVVGNPTVNISRADATVGGSVFGAGKGANDNPAVAYIDGETTVSMTTGTVRGNIYGGGEMASVGVYSYSGSTVTGLTSGGATTVTVSGGTVGVSDQGNAVHDSKATAGRTPDDKGHVFGGGLGLPGTAYDAFAYVNAPTVVINGGSVVGSVFGGGENGHVRGNTSVTVSGGTVGMNLSDFERIEEKGDGIDIYFGNVYGGGRGIDDYGTAGYSNNAGRVEGNTEVTISGGKVQRNVYGGGSLASVGNNTSGTATVNIEGGMVGTMGWNEGSVFGGCRGVVNADPAVETLIANVYCTAVNIKPGASIMGSVFGGGANGHVLDTTLVSITGGIVGHPLEEADTLTTIYGYAPRTVFRGNVYGGGRGVTPLPGGDLSTTAGRVNGNTHVEMTDGWVRHSVFGGGSMASVGTYTTDGAGDIATCTAGGRAWVEITGGYVGTQSKTFNYSTESGDGKTYEAASDGKGGTIAMVMGQGGEGRNNGRVFGSCRGTAGEDYDHLAYVNITRVIIGTYGSATGPHIMGCVFGSGENGHVLDSTYVQMHSGDIGRKVYDWKRTYIGNLYGGGRGIDFDKNNKLSKTAGWVRGSTRVEMTGGHVWHNIYGGGSLASVGELVDNPTYTPVPDIDNRHGRTTVHIVGGKVGRDGLFGGNVFGSGRGRAGLNVDTVFHLCSNECTYLNKGTNVTIGGTSRAVWTLRNRANTADSLWLARIPSVLNATVDSIYYVLNDAHTDADTVQHDFSHLTNVHNAQVIINYAAGNSDTSLHRICGSVYGSGDNGHVLNRTYVGIHSGTIGNRMTFADDAARTAYLNKYPAADRANISANIASNGMVLVSGSVYGSGRGLDLTNVGNQMSPSAGRVYGHTTVNVTGGHVMRNVYGGGNMAGVGDGTRNASGELVSSHATAGTTTVTITGGTIGKEYNEVKDAARGQWGGNVFGSSRGLSANDVHVKNMAFVRETKVDIKDGVAGSTVDPAHVGKTDESVFTVTTTAGHATIYGSVFGGGENGHVWHNTDVVIDGNVTIGYDNVASIGEPVYPGNVYGGGRGIDLTDASHVSRTSGAVYGNTHVTIKGGTIYHNVFGGGSLASVGRYIFYNQATPAEQAAAEFKVDDYVIRLADKDADFAAGKAYEGITPGIDSSWGKSYVTILGGTIGVNAVNNGRVFGAGRGIAGQDGTGNAFNYYTFVDQTLVNIKGGQINGCVFGSGDNGHVSGNTVVNVSGGTIGYSNGGPVNGNVFGSGRGADRGYKAGASGNNWYSPTAGRVRGNTQVNITGGTIKNNVYGGGFMASVLGNTEVNIGTEAGGPSDFAIWGDVFGGSALGAIGTAGNTTTVNILSGTIGSTTDGYNAGHKGNIFGGGNGDAGASSATEAVTVYVDGDPSATVNSREADVLNTVQVNIGHTSQYGDASKGATILGNVFGCNNIAGSPKADVHVDVYSTAHEDGDGISSGNVYPTTLKAQAPETDVLDTNDVNALTPAQQTALLDEARFALGEVYGGGNKADYLPASASNTTGVTIYECEENTIKYVYGGGRAADIGNNTLAVSTTVRIEGGHIKQVFAGGDGHTTVNGGAYVAGSNEYLPANIWGSATLEIVGGLIEQAFGGSNTTGKVHGTARVNFSPVSACRLMLDEAFGGGNRAEGGSTIVTIPCGFSGTKTIYGGANEARIDGDVTLNIEGGKLMRVFGGSKSADITGDVTVNVYGGSIDELFGGNDEGGNIEGTIEVNVDWGLNSCPDDTLLRYVYGGGYKAPYAPNSPYGATTSGEVTNFTPVVNIIQATVDTAVFGGGYGVGTDALTDAHIDANPKVVIGAYRVKDHDGNTIDPQPNNYVRIGKGKNELGRTLAGNVFGGGNAGPVNGSPKVIIQGSDTKVWHNVYGGGNAAMVKGNPDIEIGGYVLLSVPKVTQSGSTVTLTSREGATIHYTTDGTEPTTSSATYSDPLTVSAGTVVKAIAHKDDFAGPTKTSGVVTYTVK